MVGKVIEKLTDIDENHKCTVITVGNHKGGCGKTSLCFALANYLFDQNYRVLLIDTDPQGSLGKCFGVDGNNPKYEGHTLDEVYRELRKLGSSVINAPIRVLGNPKVPASASVVLIPGNNLINATVEYVEKAYSEENVQGWFVNLIEMYKQYFDYIIFDTTPILEDSKCCRHAIGVSDCVVIPIDAVEAADELDCAVDTVIRCGKRRPNVLFAFTMYDASKPAHVKKFDKSCVAKKLPMLNVEHIKTKGKKWERGHDERRNIIYRFMLSLFPQNVCVTGIPDQKDIRNSGYINANRGNKALVNDLCLEIKRKATSRDVENLCDVVLWSTKRDLLKCYTEIVQQFKLKAGKFKVSEIAFENADKHKVMFDKEEARKRRELEMRTARQR